MDKVVVRITHKTANMDIDVMRKAQDACGRLIQDHELFLKENENGGLALLKVYLSFDSASEAKRSTL
jgi:hypothetical protein